jgi:hypothetical protein
VLGLMFDILFRLDSSFLVFVKMINRRNVSSSPKIKEKNFLIFLDPATGGGKTLHPHMNALLKSYCTGDRRCPELTIFRPFLAPKVNISSLCFFHYSGRQRVVLVYIP